MQIVRVDIDDTICKTKGLDYMNAVPYKDRIEEVNKLHENGKTIIYWTSRGQGTGIDWYRKTYEQLLSWGCKFDRLECTKPRYDIFVDDKSCRSFEEFLSVLSST